MFCTYIRIEWKILGFRKTAFHTFPKSVYPTPLLTLKQRPNGAQTPAVFLYFSILNSLPTKKTSLFLSLQGLTDYDAILLEIYKAASCLFCKWNDEMHKTKNRIILTKQSGRPLKLKVVIRCRKKWNEPNLMYIYHLQCEKMQKIQWNSSNGQFHCFHYVR